MLPKWHVVFHIKIELTDEFVPLFQSALLSPNGKKHSLRNILSSKNWRTKKNGRQKRMEKRNEFDDFSTCSPPKEPETKMTSIISIFFIRIKASNVQCAVRDGNFILASSVFSERTSFSLVIRFVFNLFWYFVWLFYFIFSLSLCNVHLLHVYNVPECIW